jgi:hypothetical protein
MNKSAFLIVLTAIYVLGCSKPESGSSPDSAKVEASTDFPGLPTSAADKATVSGNMSTWMADGDGGCFGTLAKGKSEIEVWAEADACENIDYEDNALATLVVTFKADEQWGAGKSYSIVEFK